jgi:hypothetical protein
MMGASFLSTIRTASVRVPVIRGGRGVASSQRKAGLGRVGSVLRALWKPGLFRSATPVVAGVFVFKNGSNAHARSATVREFYAGGLESTSERSYGRTVRSQYARSAFEALYGG